MKWRCRDAMPPTGRRAGEFVPQIYTRIFKVSFIILVEAPGSLLTVVFKRRFG